MLDFSSFGYDDGGHRWEIIPDKTLAIAAVAIRRDRIELGDAPLFRSEGGLLHIPVSLKVIGPNPAWRGQDIWENITYSYMDPNRPSKDGAPENYAKAVDIGCKAINAIISYTEFFAQRKLSAVTGRIKSLWSLHGYLAVFQARVERNRAAKDGSPLPDRNVVQYYIHPFNEKRRHELLDAIKKYGWKCPTKEQIMNIVGPNPRDHATASGTVSSAVVQNGDVVIEDDIPF